MKVEAFARDHYDISPQQLESDKRYLYGVLQQFVVARQESRVVATNQLNDGAHAWAQILETFEKDGDPKFYQQKLQQKTLTNIVDTRMDEATFISMIQEAWFALEEMGPIPSSAERFDMLLTSLTTSDSIPYLAMLRSQFKNSLDPFSAVVKQIRRDYSSRHNANRVDAKRRAHHTRIADY